MAGDLRFHPLSGAELHLFGQRDDLPQNRSPQLSAIHGRSVKGEPLTLLNPLLRRDTWHMTSSGCEEHWGAVAVILGDHVSSRGQLRSHDATVRLRGLEDLLRTGLHDPDRRLDEPAATAHRGPVSLMLQFVEHEKRSQLRRENEFRPRIQLSASEPASLDEWRAAIRPIVSLVQLCGGKQCWIDEFVATGDVDGAGPAMPDAEGERARRDHFELLEQRPQSGRRARSHRGPLLPRGSLTDGVLQRWMDLHRSLEPAVFHLFGELNADSSVLENRLVSLTSYTEAYHSRLHSAEGKLRERLRWVVKRARPVIPRLEPFADRLPDEIVDSRTRIVHGKSGAASLDGMDLANALSRLVAALLANLLLDVGLGPETVRESMKNAYATHGAFSM
jgi:hypothetical protein